MDELILKLEDLTQSIVSRLNQSSYEEMSSFVEQRQVLIDSINEWISNGLVSSSQKHRLASLLQIDALILGRLNTLKEEAGNWLQQRGQAKVQRNVYDSGYTPDSILMDRRR